MSINRLDEAKISVLVGGASVARLRRKVTGGANGFKGIRYEHFFGGHQFATLARAYLENGIDHEVEWQGVGFVDDYIVRHDDGHVVSAFQLKNSPSVSWAANDHAITNDFKDQFAVSAAEGYKTIRVELVCSSEPTVASLQASMPADISTYSKVSYFPYEMSFSALLYSNAALADDFSYLSNRSNPALVDAQQVADVMMGAWAARAPQSLVSEVLDQARMMSPQLVRSSRGDDEAVAQLSPALLEILDSLPEFSYQIDRGFLQWSALSGTMSGVLSFDCFSPQFAKWQKMVTDTLKPKLFDDLEGVLL